MDAAAAWMCNPIRHASNSPRGDSDQPLSQPQTHSGQAMLSNHNLIVQTRARCKALESEERRRVDRVAFAGLAETVSTSNVHQFITASAFTSTLTVGRHCLLHRLVCVRNPPMSVSGGS